MPASERAPPCWSNTRIFVDVMTAREKRNTYQLEYYYRNRDRLVADMRERYRLNSRRYEERRKHKLYGVSPEQFQEMLNKQNGLCAICRKPEKRTRNGKLTMLAVDHCSAGGHVRALLCASCNTALGLLKHSVSMAERVLKYLRSETLFNQHRDLI